MPVLTAPRKADEAKRDVIRKAIRQAVDEFWTLDELAAELGVTPRMARIYAQRENYRPKHILRPDAK